MNVELLVVLPIMVPLFGAAACVLLRKSNAWQRWVALLTVIAQFFSAWALLFAIEPGKPIAFHVGSWAPGVGIVLVADVLAAVMTLMTAGVGLLAMWYGFGRLKAEDESNGHHPLVLALLAGVAGAFLTGDLFNLFVWFEVLLMASFVLLGFGRGGWRREGTVKYLILNLFASTCFLSAVGLLYAEYGSLSMASLATMSDPETMPPVAAWLLITAFAIKAGIFPCYIWLPGAYHAPGPLISAVFAALLTKVGVYALIRSSTLLFHGHSDMIGTVLVVGGLLTMISGALGALAQQHLRRILAFHVISQVGYMVVAIGLGSAVALAAAVVYLVHHIVVKAALFLVGGAIAEREGTEDLRSLGGLAERAPWLAVGFLIPALSLAGIPPFSGFIGKLAVVQAGAAEEAWTVVAICLAGGVLTLLSMLKIWLAVFWGKTPEGLAPAIETPAEPHEADGLDHGPTKAGPCLKKSGPRLAPLFVLVMVTITLGIAAAPLVELAQGAGAELADPSSYIAESLRESPEGE